jgi:hypothetical protein
VREHHYGFTVERVWAFVVAGFAVLYALGYGYAAVTAGRWMARIARVNVTAAFIMMAVLVLTLTPLLSPYRLAADSQYERAIHWSGNSDHPHDEQRLALVTPFHYLRFDAGSYGQARLHLLADPTNADVAPAIRELAAAALAQETPWVRAPIRNAESILSTLPIYPAGRKIEPALNELLRGELERPTGNYPRLADRDLRAGLYVDLNEDGAEEFLLLWSTGASVYQNSSGSWRAAGTMSAAGMPSEDLLRLLSSGTFSTRRPRWDELLIGQRVYRLQDPAAAQP